MRSRRTMPRIPLATIAGLLAAGLIAVVAYAAPGQSGFQEHRGPNGETDVNVCSDATPAGVAHCFARVRTDDLARNSMPRPPAPSRSARPAASIGNQGAYDPAYLQAAYNAPSTTAGSGQTIAIVDAYDNPNAYNDMAFYRNFFGLPPCTGADPNGCSFRKVDQNGGTSYPRSDSGWAQESALDLDMASALCPNCKILLVEAASNSFANLGTAVNRAALMGAQVISNSYGGGEWSTESSSSGTYYNHPGIAITVSSGDNGYGVEFPAASQYVTAVGGTSLYQTGTSGRSATETVWSGAGSGCSAYEPKPSWQLDTGCSRRTVADVSAVADPNTPVWVRYNSGWYWFGGTSVASPIIGGIYALAGNTESTKTLASYPYSTPASLNDVVSGSNGNCSVTYLCNGVSGYDGPTGLGTPNTTTGFKASSTPPPTPGAPTGLQATAGDAKVTLNWTAPSGTSLTYKIYRGATSGSETLLASGVTTVNYTDSTVLNGSTYFYKVTAVNSVGAEGSPSNEVSASPVAAPPPAPGAPTALQATAGNGQVTLNWTAPSGTSLTYKVYRGATSGSETLLASGVTTVNYTDSTVLNGSTYFYRVTAVNSVGAEGPPSNEVSASPVAAPPGATAPTAPQNFAAASARGKGVSLSWSVPSSNGGAAITGYQVWRRTGSGTSALYATVSCTSSTCSYKDTVTSRGATYTYKVAAVNSVGAGAFTGELSAVAS